MLGLGNIPVFENIDVYNQAINISRPAFEDVDVRSFEHNMPLVPSKMKPFRNNFYQVAIVMHGSGELGQNSSLYDFKDYTLFFNIPGQVLCWNIINDWSGFYMSFNAEALSSGPSSSAFLSEFPFLKTGESKFFHVNKEEATTLYELFEKAYHEYSNPTIYNKTIIQSYLGVVLQYGKRFYDRDQEVKQEKRETSSLTQRFEDLLIDMFKPVQFGSYIQLKQVNEIADELFVSSKHLSEVLKRETGSTANQHIQKRIVHHARQLLIHTSYTVSEIAFQLGMDNPPYFTRLFKKHEGLSPVEFRNSHQSSS